MIVICCAEIVPVHILTHLNRIQGKLKLNENYPSIMTRDGSIDIGNVIVYTP